MYIDTTQEELLRERLRCGDKEALFSLMIIYYNDLFKYALKFTSDPELTKDLVNQFFIHVWENRTNLYKAEKIKPYLIVSFLICHCLMFKMINRYKGQLQEEMACVLNGRSCVQNEKK